MLVEATRHFLHTKSHWETAETHHNLQQNPSKIHIPMISPSYPHDIPMASHGIRPIRRLQAAGSRQQLQQRLQGRQRRLAAKRRQGGAHRSGLGCI